MDLLGSHIVLFLAAALLVLRLPVPVVVRRSFLITFNFAFLASFDRLAPLVFLATASYAFALAAFAKRIPARWMFALACAPLLVPLFLPKIVAIASEEAGTVANAFGSRLGLFIGSSYFTLRALHFVLDARRIGRIDLPFTEYLAWNSFFPTIVAGPIERSQHFARSLDTLGLASFEDVRAGLVRIFQGLVKRVVVAPLFLAWSGDITNFDAALGLDAGRAWLALYAIVLYAYFDFAGYSDLALGAARLLGIRLAENFDNPYLRPSITEFWKGWHISLSTWIRDYLFLPICGRSTSKVRPHVAALVSMTLCGLWHGVAVGWILWGLAHGIGLSVHQLWTTWLRKRFKLRKQLAGSFLVRGVATAVTFHFVALTWVLISVDTNDVGAALRYFGALLGLGGGTP